MLTPCILFFFFNDTATTEIYTLSLHDALPISVGSAPVATVTVSPAAPSLAAGQTVQLTAVTKDLAGNLLAGRTVSRSEEHTSELQSQSNLVCRLLLEKKKKNKAVYG